MFAKNPAAAAKLQSPSALTALHKVRYACRGRLISRFVPRQKIKKVRADLANYTSSKTDRSLDQFVPRRVKKPRESAACILQQNVSLSRYLILRSPLYMRNAEDGTGR